MGDATCSPSDARCRVTQRGRGEHSLLHGLVLVESTESPHCIALEVATVRYNVEEKGAVTCDDAQTPWSGEGRVLLCKQGVAGSSPVVSTAKVLVIRACFAC